MSESMVSQARPISGNKPIMQLHFMSGREGISREITNLERHPDIRLKWSMISGGMGTLFVVTSWFNCFMPIDSVERF